MSETILGVIIGGLIAGLPTVIITWLNHREERKRQSLDTAMQCALTEWKGIAETCLDEARRGHDASIPPLRSYMLNAYFTMKAISETDDPEKIKEEVRKADELCRDIHITANPKKRNKTE
tara:strand:+ start:132 stop:491 length:360 start_codon:yes stop_codon:yes gene_type:complete